MLYDTELRSWTQRMSSALRGILLECASSRWRQECGSMLRAEVLTQVSRREFLKQRKEICTTLSCHLEPTSSNNAGGVSIFDLPF